MILYNDRRQVLTWGLTTLALCLLAIGLRVYLRPAETETMSGGGWVGLTYGILGGALILFALSLTLLRFVPSWSFLGRRSVWLKGHIWLGTLSFVLILCHSGLRFGGFFEQVLYLAFFLVVLTGIAGVALQQFLPRWLTQEVPCEVPYEQIPNVCAAMRDNADLEVDVKCTSPVPATAARIRSWYGDVVRPYLSSDAQPTSVRTSLLAEASKTAQMFADMRSLAGIDATTADLLSRLETYCQERRRLARQQTLHAILHGWLYIHVPLSWAMTVLMLAHALMAGLYYHQ